MPRHPQHRVSAVDPFDLLFAGLEKLGPGDNAYTHKVLKLLPQRRFNVVVDAGCGTGRQTLALAAELRTQIHAVDSRASFLDQLSQRAAGARTSPLLAAKGSLLMDPRLDHPFLKKYAFD